ncbi:MAG: potassium transporter TrkG, partial [Myxococcota bacterium]
MIALGRASGAIAAGGPLLSLFGARLHSPDWWMRGLSTDVVQAWPIWLLWVSSLVVTVGGWRLFEGRTGGRNLVGVGLAGWVLQGAMPALSAPELALGGLAAIATMVHFLFPHRPSREEEPQTAMVAGRLARVRSAAVVTLVGLGFVALAPRPLDGGAVVAEACSLGVVALLAADANRRALGQPRWARAVVWASGPVAALGVAVARGQPFQMLVAAALIPVAVLVSYRPPVTGKRLLPAVADFVGSQPARLLVVTFLGLSAMGTFLLRLPVASAAGTTLNGIDAAFTATSAVCVTGLIVLDTPVDFSVTGQVLLLVLIQLGGLGIMSFSTAAFAALGRRLSLRHESAVADLIKGGRRQIFGTLRRLLLVTFVTEAMGAGLLSLLFRQHGDGWPMALWRGLFTSVSAFCNAGFALQSDSLIPYQSDPLVLHVIAIIIIIGGLSPAVVLELPTLIRRPRRASVQGRLVMVVSVALLFSAALLVGALEWNHSLRHLGLVDRIHGAWFQSVTLRTAGFNSVDFGALQPGTQWSMLFFMFIGGSPGGTAGGIKTTTLAVLCLALGGAMRGQWEVSVYRRRIPHKTLYEAAAVSTIAMALVFVGVIALTVTQGLPLLGSLFEVVSAVATVGVSVGATGQLDDVGK